MFYSTCTCSKTIYSQIAKPWVIICFIYFVFCCFNIYFITKCR